MIRRLVRYAADAYRPAVQVPIMILWAVGLTGLFARLDPRIPQWSPDGGLAVTAATLACVMLLLRAMDDLRDRDYDRRHHPGRPLPSGQVKAGDLVVLVSGGTVALLVLNLPRGMVAVALAVQLGYAVAVVTADHVLRWPSGDRLFLQLVINLPIQPLLSLYVYAGFLRSTGLTPDRNGAAGVAVATFAGLCIEFGRKATRWPRPGERTYSSVLGPGGTTAAATFFALAAVALVLFRLRPWTAEPWGWIVLVPVMFPLWSAARFLRGRARWPVLPTLAYVPATYASFMIVGWLTR